VVNSIKLSAVATREFWEIAVLFEDEHFLALDKPAGLRESPDPLDRERPNLAELLQQGIAAAKPWATTRNLNFLEAAHHLDAETSGVYLFAKNKDALIALTNLFGSDQPELRYLALVAGLPGAAHFEVNARLAPNVVRLGMMRVDAQSGKKALTRFAVAETFTGFTMLECRPLTQRPHQIRAHLRHAGFPLVGDALYGGKPLWLSRLKPNYRLKHGREERPLLAQPALHLEQLKLVHPVTGQPLEITAPLPKELRVALRYLREFRGSGGREAGRE
jgi:RluA family pseudouridine synthase